MTCFDLQSASLRDYDLYISAATHFVDVAVKIYLSYFLRMYL
jgi:hypothetical protein